jgi:serine/threonine protein kinase
MKVSSHPSGRSPPRKPGRDAARLLGSTISGKYRIRNIIGVGGNGLVYEADDVTLWRKVAIKVPTGRRAPAFTSMRFRREARAGSSVAHANVCALYDFGSFDDGTPFLVMERLIGETLGTRLIREGWVPLYVAIHVMTQVLAGLGAAHERGIVHRDMKPGNIFLTEAGALPSTAKVLDFGSSTFNVAEPEPEDETTDLLTAVGTAVGTPLYMSPEQILGHRDFDPRVDVFACGVILYEMVSGRRPFNASSTKDLFDQILLASPRPVSSVRSDLPQVLDQVLAKSITANRRDRYPSAEAFAAALESLRADVPTPSASWSPLGARLEPGAERLAYLQARFRELAGLHRRAISEPTLPRPSTNTLEIPIIFEDDSAPPRASRLPSLRDDDPEGTAPTKPKRNSRLLDPPSAETTTARRARRPRASRGR